MSKAAVQKYTGTGEPPFCEIAVIANDDDGSTPPDLTLPVTLTGVEQPTTITLKRDAERPVHVITQSGKNIFELIDT